MIIGGKEIENSPQNVKTIDSKAEFKALGIIDIEEVSDPISLAVNERGEIALLNKEFNDCRVELFNADGEHLRDIGGEGSGDELIEPGQVIFNEDKILISDFPLTGCGCIKEFDADGNYKKTICKQSKGIYISEMCKTNQNIAFLRYILNTKETFLNLLDKKSYNHLCGNKLDVPDHVRGPPCSLAYGNNKYFVSFYRENTVYVFGDNGTLLSTIGEKGNSEGQFDSFCGLALAVFGKEMLLVCDVNNHRVQVFSQDGEFIRSFGRKGSSLGQMQYPYDVAVAPDGRVFVLECELGKRVQVWK